MTFGLRWTILFGRAARSFAIGAMTVAMPFVFKRDGFDTMHLNAALSAGLAGATLQMQLVSVLSGYLGRLPALGVCTAAIAVAGGITACSESFCLILISILIGGMSLQPNISVQAPLEQATLADIVSKEERANVFAWYNGVSSLAIAAGQFVVALPASGNVYFQFQACSVILAMTAAAYFIRGNAKIETGTDSKEVPLVQSEDLVLTQCRHYRRILGMAGLFAVDSFAGGMILNSFLIHWLVSQYQMDKSTLGTLFAASSVITTPSLWVAAWLGNRIGYVNTMVFTHIPSNILCSIMPFMPNAKWVSFIVLARGLLSQMDVPARDAFMTSVVDPEERVACSSFIAFARGLACVAGPLFGAFLLRQCGTSSPLIVAGVLKCIYDLSLLFYFRAVHAPTEHSEE